MAVKGFVFVDLETTGIDARTSAILEMGFALYSRELELVDSWSTLTVTTATLQHLAEVRGDPQRRVVADMHTTNGLFADIDRELAANAPPATLAPYIDAATTVLRGWGVDRTTPLCGSSLRMDREFLKTWAPELDALFSYRIIDASSVWKFHEVRHPDTTTACLNAAQKVRSSQHRVLGDMHASANLLRVFDGLEPLPLTA